jgi:filamentous hemagglutinin
MSLGVIATVTVTHVTVTPGYSGTGSKAWAGVKISPNQISGRGLDVVVPHAGSATQQQIINDIIKYGASRPNPVTVRVIPYP